MKRAKTKVVIVGAGFGGVKTALELARKPGFAITLISNNTNFEYHGALYRTATGNSPMEVVIPLRDIFKSAPNVEVVLDKIAKVVPRANAVKSESGRAYAYDQLVLALGNEVNYYGLEGMEDKTFCISSVRQTIALRHELITRFKTDKSCTVAIVGGGATGVELAGEVLNFAHLVARKYLKKAVNPNVVIIEGADRLLPGLDPVLSAKAYKRLQKLGVEIKLGTRVNSCEEGKVCLNTGDLPIDVIVWTAGSRLPEFYEHNHTVFKQIRGRIAVDEHLAATEHKNIYVIGDNALTKYSGMAQTAIYDAKFIARNFVRARRGKNLVKYRPRKPIYIVPVGKNWAVYQSATHILSGYKAWVLRRRADLWIFKNFQPYKKAVKHWRRGNRKGKY